MGIKCNNKLETFNDLFLYISTLDKEERTRLITLSINKKNKDLGWILSINTNSILIKPYDELYNLINEVTIDPKTPT